MQKRAVILGGVGLIGTHLCLRLLGEGYEVFCVDIRDVSDSPLLREVKGIAGFRYVHHNITNPFGIRCDEIYNLATPTMLRYDKALPVETLKVNLQGSINALETARTEFARILYASSGDVYGTMLRESFTEEGFSNASGRALAEGKRAAEVLHAAYHDEYGVDTRIARIFNTYGPGADPSDQRVVMKMIVAALQNRDIPINGSGEQLRTFCWVEDIVDGLVRLMDAPPTETARTINFGSSHEVSIRALAEKIVELTGSRSRINHVEARRDDPRRRMPDIAAARRELDWTPRTPLAEGLRRTIEYAEKELAGARQCTPTWVEIH